MDKKHLTLRILSIICAVLGILTVVPFPSATKASILGYKSICTFMPVSTVVLLYGAYLAHKYVAGKNKG